MQNLYTRKLGEISVFYEVNIARSLPFSLQKTGHFFIYTQHLQIIRKIHLHRV